MKRLSTILKALDLPYRIMGDDVQIESICYDSRVVKANSLFVAIKGYAHDGHDYVDQAIKNGAAAVVIERDMDIHVSKLITADTRRALAELSFEFYGTQYNNFDLCGITGTNGKTTMTHLLYQLCEADQKVPALVGTLGIKTPFKHIAGERTTPESSDLAKLFYDLDKKMIDSLFMEVSSHALALKRVHHLRFEAAAFTNLTQDHLDFHENMEDYFKAKSQLFYHLNPGAKSIINIDDPYGKRLYNSLEIAKVSYAVDNNEADYHYKELQLGVKGIQGVLVTPEGHIKINAPLLGKFNAENISGAIAIYRSMYPNSALKMDEFHFKSVPGRMETIMTSKATAVVDYAHTPDAMEKALKAASKIEDRKNIICVFGCGGDRDKDKRSKMGAIAEKYSNTIIITNDNPRNEDPQSIADEILTGINDKQDVRICLDRAKAIKEAWMSSKVGDILMVLGKGAETYMEIKGQRLHFDDRERLLELKQL